MKNIMNIRQRLLLVMALLVFFLDICAQSDISMSTHWYNRANYNPASIARTDYLYIFSNLRQQWTGVNGAPKTFNIQASEYIHSLRSAFGISLVNDRVGVTQVINPMLSYAYRISNHQKWSLSMGLSAGIFTRTMDGSLYEADVINDASINYSKEKISRPDANMGLEFQNTHFIAGISSTHLVSIFKANDSYINANHRYGYIIYRDNSPELFNYNIGLQVINRNYLTVAEGNISLRFKRQTGLLKGPSEMFDVGLTYRTSKQITLLLGINILPNIRAGYAYDQSFAAGYSLNTTHEIMVEYRIPRKAASTKFRCGDSLFWYQ